MEGIGIQSSDENEQQGQGSPAVDDMMEFQRLEKEIDDELADMCGEVDTRSRTPGEAQSSFPDSPDRRHQRV